jgi:hypothetical protein
MGNSSFEQRVTENERATYESVSSTIASSEETLIWEGEGEANRRV